MARDRVALHVEPAVLAFGRARRRVSRVGRGRGRVQLRRRAGHAERARHGALQGRVERHVPRKSQSPRSRGQAHAGPRARGRGRSRRQDHPARDASAPPARRLRRGAARLRRAGQHGHLRPGDPRARGLLRRLDVLHRLRRHRPPLGPHAPGPRPAQNGRPRPRLQGPARRRLERHATRRRGPHRRRHRRLHPPDRRPAQPTRPPFSCRRRPQATTAQRERVRSVVVSGSPTTYRFLATTNRSA
mmetsp:Transcript_30241/g.92520  ORF Transcript_30241/g.92520 Transcript_30241/m.92520 type:complete len:244 (+) Transcript_30241:537-1268(+)